MDSLIFEQSFFSGIFVATLIPMHADLSCDVQELAHHCRDLIQRGCRGIVIFGTTGEGPSFSVEERKQIVQELIQMGIEPQRLIVGICCTAIQEAVDLACAALDLHCLGVLVLPPFFYKQVTDEGVIAFYREMITRVNDSRLQMILYHIPQYSGVALNAHIVKTLKDEFPDIVIGMKDSEGNLALIQEVLDKCPGFKVFVGRERILLEAIQLGAVGGISGMANAFPELLHALYAYGQDPKKANPHAKIERLLKILQNYPIFSALKSILEHQRGSLWHPLRPPLVPLQQAQSQALMAALSQEIRDK